MADETLLVTMKNVKLDIKRAIITASASGNTPVVAAVTGKKIRVLSYRYRVNAQVNVKWQSNTTDIDGLGYNSGQGDGEVAPFNPLGWLETAAGQALNINLSGAVAVGGQVIYIEV